jgi:hypothetical protein
MTDGRNSPLTLRSKRAEGHTETVGLPSPEKDDALES